MSEETKDTTQQPTTQPADNGDQSGGKMFTQEDVNRIVSEVENRKVLTSEKNINDKIDAILTNKIAGIIIFAVVVAVVSSVVSAVAAVSNEDE